MLNADAAGLHLSKMSQKIGPPEGKLLPSKPLDAALLEVDDPAQVRLLKLAAERRDSSFEGWVTPERIRSLAEDDVYSRLSPKQQAALPKLWARLSVPKREVVAVGEPERVVEDVSLLRSPVDENVHLRKSSFPSKFQELIENMGFVLYQRDIDSLSLADPDRMKGTDLVIAEEREQLIELRGLVVSMLADSSPMIARAEVRRPGVTHFPVAELDTVPFDLVQDVCITESVTINNDEVSSVALTMRTETRWQIEVPEGERVIIYEPGGAHRSPVGQWILEEGTYEIGPESAHERFETERKSYVVERWQGQKRLSFSEVEIAKPQIVTTNLSHFHLFQLEVDSDPLPRVLVDAVTTPMHGGRLSGTWTFEHSFSAEARDEEVPSAVLRPLHQAKPGTYRVANPSNSEPDVWTVHIFDSGAVRVVEQPGKPFVYDSKYGPLTDGNNKIDPDVMCTAATRVA